MSDTPSYEELVQAVNTLQNKVNDLENNYIKIRREPATSTPTSLDGGEAVLTPTGLSLGVGGGVANIPFA